MKFIMVRQEVERDQVTGQFIKLKRRDIGEFYSNIAVTKGEIIEFSKVNYEVIKVIRKITDTIENHRESTEIEMYLQVKPYNKFTENGIDNHCIEIPLVSEKLRSGGYR